MHLTDDNNLESILERQGDGLVAHPVEELGCIAVGAGTSMLSLWNNKRQNADWTPAKPRTATQQRSRSAL